MKFLTKKKIITVVAVLAIFFGGSNYYYETKLKTKDIYLETEYPSINVGDEIELNYIVEPDTAEKIIKRVVDEIQTGTYGDGKIFVYEVQDAVRIRTGERGSNAL